MMHRLLRHPVAVVACFAVVVLTGVLSVATLPVELLPSLSIPRLVVRTTYGDASPEEVESLVTRPVEEAVATVSGVRGMHSTSSEGLSSVTLSFDWGVNLGAVSADVREKLDLIADDLPRDVKLPIVMHYDPSDDPMMILALTGDGATEQARVFAEKDVKPRIQTVAGVAAVRVSGGIVPEVQVLGDRGRLVAAGFDLKRVLTSIEAANINFPVGKVLQGPLELHIRTVGRFRSAEEIKSLPVGRGRVGSVVRVEDVAEVIRTHRDRTSICRLNGSPTVFLRVIKEPAANAVTVSKAVRETIERSRPLLPAGISIEIVDDQ
ncbi:MAG: efflux RND transporter permease subunit, partial [Pseudomonadota bacterium]